MSEYFARCLSGNVCRMREFISQVIFCVCAGIELFSVPSEYLSFSDQIYLQMHKGRSATPECLVKGRVDLS